MVGVGPPRARVQHAEEGVEAGGGAALAAHPREQPGGVLRDHPGVLGRVALDEAAALERVVGEREGAAREARLDQAAARVEELAPVGGAGDELLVGRDASPPWRAANWAIAKSSSAYLSVVAAEPQTALGLP